MCSQAASEPSRTYREEQKQPKPWGGSPYWEPGRMETVVSVKKRLDKRMCWRGHQDEGINLWHIGKGEKVIIRCNPGQMEARVASAREPRESPVAEVKEVWDQIWKTGEHERVQFTGQEW